jgi:hypothetical protein
MNRSRLVLFISVLIVALGVVAGLGALWLDSARADVGPLPGKSLVLPADTQFVMGIDVQRLIASPMWTRWRSNRALQPETVNQLERWTGLDAAHDVDQVVVAGAKPADGKRPTPLVMVMGHFNLEKLSGGLEKAGAGSGSPLEGATLFTMEKNGVSSSLAVLDTRTLIFGPTAKVQEVVKSRARGETPLRQNEELLSLVGSIKPGSAFWAVGGRELLSAMPKGVPAPGMGGAGAASLNLPPLQSLTMTGDFDPQLSFSLTGVAVDAESATKLADVLRGLVALMSLQAQQKPELAQLSSAFSISTEDAKVFVNARLPYELLEALQPKKEQGAETAEESEGVEKSEGSEGP